MFEEAISLLSIWASMNSWLTPTVLFLLLNLMIGTIAVTSGFTSHKPSHHHHSHHLHHHHNHQSPPHQPPQQLQPQLSRSSSVLQRLKSINFYTYNAPPPTTHFQQPPPAPSPPPQQQPNPIPEPHLPTVTTAFAAVEVAGEEDDDERPTLDEIYSRIKLDNSVSHYNRQNSDTKPSGGEIPVKLSKKMKKSASHKSAFNHFHVEPENHENARHRAVPSTVEEDFEEERENAPPVQLFREEREREEHDNGVDAKADDFINRFKKQLQMQRNDSIVRYKEMIHRTSAQ
ncbi:transcription factor Sox-1-like [Chenopodium quinoa]|uniref:transcription factor Sox-1-like n=1 Tax=Chenopodium quinoa TaxID=63459 RepID=UPI000B76DC68|nr:transcription factor Sox-1-like [Chenopodium quinoa]